MPLLYKASSLLRELSVVCEFASSSESCVDWEGQKLDGVNILNKSVQVQCTITRISNMCEHITNTKCVGCNLNAFNNFFILINYRNVV